MNWFNFSCVHCQKPLNFAHRHLCYQCDKQISRLNYCGRCGAVLSKNQAFRGQMFCGNCAKQSPNWQQMVVIGRYQPPLSTLIHQFKFQNRYYLDRTLAQLMLLAIYHARREYLFSLPEVIVPVPLHHFRQWYRGYNQAYLIAKQLSRQLSIPLDNKLVVRQKYTKMQRGLNEKARRSNLHNAFNVNIKRAKQYHSIALIDDVITTGSTLNEIAKLLKQAGINVIHVWGLAKT
ncbi:ComF family protein [Histophilus somni]|uniref:ComF family protein n=1 Tax=Histophilus somni TaxID=731 RepID=UPI0000397149|nr:phosphoribosyltransferase family protein [Histophilus somni]ACA32160.1 competence protein [Histophilus somni 2336]QQF86334.1 amidophosphoribosyltransferase [Histophilus somni]QQJ89865.1 amidophosphoribosyltransferase [Histophilus somni]